MVQVAETKSYPRIPTKNWWDLRRRFRQSPPRQVDVSYLQTVLRLSEGAAKNLLPSLRVVGLIDDSGQPTQRAMEWRDDDRYANVCEEIREQTYPRSLLDALPPPNPDRDQVERWFARETGTGEAAAKKMAAFYLLLCEADTSAAERAPERPTREQAQQRPRRRSAETPPRQRGAAVTTETPLAPTPSSISRPDFPAVHIDINVHIDADASPQQIDQLFESMARHLYGREEQR
jgi:hypothetical protein